MLLTTKLFMPQSRPNRVVRLRLHKLLEAGVTGKVILVSAPAGFGKTTLIGDWLQSRLHDNGSGTPTAVAWLTLDDGDNDPFRFISYLVAALQKVDAMLGAALPMLLQTPPVPPVATLLTMLINDIGNVSDALLLVLDDYHAIASEEIHTAVTFLVEHLPPPVTLILTTRVDPPLPLSRWRVRQLLTEVRQRDLRFHGEEAAAFLQATVGDLLSPADVNALATRTEGWIAGLQLAALALQAEENGHHFVQNFTGSNTFVIDYLVEEVLQRQPPAVVQFLLATAILPRLCGALCDAVTGGSDGQALLEQLQRANLFIIPLDGERQWYRFHQLFAEVLQHRLRRNPAALIHDYHRRASHWYRQQHLWAEALHHLLAAQEFAAAAELVEEQALATAATYQFHTLQNWLQALPAPLRQARPGLILAAAWLAIGVGPVAQIEVHLQQAEQLLAHDSSVTARHWQAQVVAARAISTGLAQQYTATVAHARQALLLLAPAQQQLRQTVTVQLGYALLWTGDLAGAEATVNTLLTTLGHEPQPSAVHVLNRLLLGVIRFTQGRLTEAENAFQQALDSVSYNGQLLPSTTSTLALLELSRCAYERNNLAAAAAYAQRSRLLAEAIASPLFMAHSQAMGGVIAHARGAGDGLGQCRQALQQLHALGANSLALVANQYLLLCLKEDNLAEATAWADAFAHSHTPAPHALTLYDVEWLALARLWLAQGQWREADHLLQAMRDQAAAEGKQWLVLGACLLQAKLATAQGQPGAATAALLTALTLAEPEGYVRSFVDEGEPLRQLLFQFPQTNAAPHLLTYIERLLAAFAAEAGAVAAGQASTLPQSPPKAQPLIDPLSDREREVLQLVAAGFSNSEIADKLILAIGTVKKHLNNIFSKLSVTSRTQALVKARELGLL